MTTVGEGRGEYERRGGGERHASGRGGKELEALGSGHCTTVKQ